MMYAGGPVVEAVLIGDLDCVRGDFRAIKPLRVDNDTSPANANAC